MQQHQPHSFICDRFVNNALTELRDANRNPIYGYQHFPLLSLERATEKILPIVSGLSDYVAQAKQQCNRNTTILSWDESAAIYLYSMPTLFFSRLNEALRNENRHVLKPWFSFLKLLLHALGKLPSLEIVVWRGVASSIGSNFVKNDHHIWWSVNSCSTDLHVVQFYLCENSTLFAIKSVSAKDISSYSSFQAEHEVVLLPGIRLRVQSNTLNYEDRLFIVHLEEVIQPIVEPLA